MADDIEVNSISLKLCGACEGLCLHRAAINIIIMPACASDKLIRPLHVFMVFVKYLIAVLRVEI